MPPAQSRVAQVSNWKVESGGAKWSKSIDGAVQRRTCLDMLMQKKEDSKMQRTKPSTKRARQGRRNLSLGHATLWNAQPKVIAALHYDKL